jgi:hypothetical protein
VQTLPLLQRHLLHVIPGAGGFGLNGINDGLIMTNTGNFRNNNNGRPPRTMHWIQYEWKQPINTKEIGLYWWNFNGNIRLPEGYHIKYWDGNNFVDVKKSIWFWTCQQPIKYNHFR